MLESEAFVFAGLDQIVALLSQRVLGGDIDGKVWSTLVNGILCFVAERVVLDRLVQAEKDHLRNEFLGVECLNHLILRNSIRVFADDGLDILVLNIGEFGLVLCQWLQVVASKELGRWVLESSRQEDIVAAKEAKSVQW